MARRNFKLPSSRRSDSNCGDPGNDESNVVTLVLYAIYEENIKITKQGLEFRFTKEAVALMEGMFEEGLNVFRSNTKFQK